MFLFQPTFEILNGQLCPSFFVTVLLMFWQKKIVDQRKSMMKHLSHEPNAQVLCQHLTVISFLYQNSTHSAILMLFSNIVLPWTYRRFKQWYSHYNNNNNNIFLLLLFSFFNIHLNGGLARVSFLWLTTQQPAPTKKNNPEVKSIEGKSNVISKTSTLPLSALNLCTYGITGRRQLLLCGGTVKSPEFLYDYWPISNTVVSAASGGRVLMSGNDDFLCPHLDPHGDFSSLVLIISL